METDLEAWPHAGRDKKLRLDGLVLIITAPAPPANPQVARWSLPF